MSFRFPLIVAALAASIGLPAAAEEILLTVTAHGETHEYDLEALKALPVVEFTTGTVWTEGKTTFTGAPLSRILEDAGIEVGSVMATAINDYSVEIPVDEVDADYPIIAYLADGEEMSARDKGPLWVVYPYDAHREYQTEISYSRSIWQVDRILGAD